VISEPRKRREEGRAAAWKGVGRGGETGPGRKQGKLGFGLFSKGVFLFLFFFSKPFSKLFFFKKTTLNYFLTLVKPIISINHMHEHEDTSMLLIL